MATDVIPAHLTADQPEMADELDEALLIGGTLPERAERFKIETVGQAEWAMRKLAVLAARREQVTAQADEWVDRIDEWERAELHRLAPGLEYFTGLLKRFGLEMRLADPRRATIPLPSGEIATTKPKTPKIEVADEGAVIAWCADHLPGTLYDKVVKTDPHLLVSELRKVTGVVEHVRDFCKVCGAALADHLVVAGAPDAPDHDFVNVVEYSVVWPDEDGTEHTLPGVTATLGDTTATVKPL